MKKIPQMLTPGPTEVPSDVLKAMSQSTVNPDLDASFSTLYDRLRDKNKKSQEPEMIFSQWLP